MGLLQTTLVLIAAAGLLGAWRHVTLWLRIRSRRIRLPETRTADAAGLPDALAPVFDAAARALEPLGFVAAGARWSGSIHVDEGPRPERVFAHFPTGSLAIVGPALPGMGDRPYRVAFATPLGGGGAVVTTDGVSHLTPGTPPDWDCRDHDVNDLGRQWKLHLGALESHGDAAAVARCDLDRWNETETRGVARMLEAWSRSGVTRAVRAGGGDRRFAAAAAWRLAGAHLACERRVLAAEAVAERSRARQQLWRSSLEPVTDCLEPGLDGARAASMAWAFAHAEAAERVRRDLRDRRETWLIRAGGAAVCLLPIVWRFGWGPAAAVVAVVAVRRIGHRAGLAWLGARDRRAGHGPTPGATGSDGSAPTTARAAMVSLLGPMPGLIAGLICMWRYTLSSGTGWLVVGLACLAVNYTSLLPVARLDGGRLVESLLLSRYPRAQVLFLALGTAAFGAAAAVWRSPIAAGVAVALFVSLRTARAAAATHARAAKRLAEGGHGGTALSATFETLQEPPFAASPVPQRARLARLVVPRLERPAAPARLALLGATLYLLVLVGVPAAVTSALYRGGSSPGAPAGGFDATRPIPVPGSVAGAADPDHSSRSSISPVSAVGR